ncbi:MAG: hypothetical protein RI956_419 [Pseudomonadota bacterium]|jgi:hypothetical protein
MEFAVNANLKQELTDLIVRHIAEEGLTYYEAKRKAAKQTKTAEHNVLMPSNDTIETALRDYLITFVPEYSSELLRLRKLACIWLSKLDNLIMVTHGHATLFAVGAVVNGTATQHSPIHIHIFTDDFKDLEIALLNSHIALEHTEKKVNQHYYPAIVAQEADVPIVMTILPVSQYVFAKTVQTATHAQLQAIIKVSVLKL